ncbi:Transcription factor [Penicillium robsamsonii]|uniref:Transcription factor n=1 Tax=Penicillium robsamsonii TaxID=1792511 RepID=UPI0025497403|nr:Transcription factor [Penicillium robsamsonii]KAJ5825097.1 Transcription factor [Penicillium robsamsonii]
MKGSHHESSKQFPALAPGPPRMFASQTSTAVSRPKKNSTACLACKAAKRKCSGPDAPCKACRSANTECHFDPSRDLRRKVAVKRTIQELTNHKDLLETLLSTLGSTDQLQFDKVMDLIRNKASFQDIALAVGSPTTTFGDPQELSNASKMAILEYGENPIETSGNEARRPSDPSTIASSPEEIPNIKPPQWPTVSPYARVTLESLCDIPLFEVPAKPWTKVTDDDYLVSHLVSLYFTWDHPCSQFLDQRVFLEHMKRGDGRSEFCTPLLVNSLLSIASAYSDSPDVLSTPENVFSRGQNFFYEAQRLWEVEDDDHDLPNIQALLLMCCVFKCQGRVRKSWMMLSQAVQLARDIGLFDAPAGSKNKMLPEMERVRTITAWGVFNMSSQMSIELQKIAPLPYPTSDVKLCGNEDFDWTPYPRSNKITYDKKPACLPKVREGLAEITRILVDVQKLVSEKARGTSCDELWRKSQGPFDCLNTWLQQWPSVSEIQQNPVPQVLLLRIKCLQAIIYLVEILNDPLQPHSVRQARFYQVKSAEETAQCLRIHRLSYGLKHIPSQMVDAVQTGLRILVHQLEVSDQSRQAFAELCRFGTALSHRFKQTADAIHEIRKNALHLNIRLSPEAIGIFDDPENWRSLEP